MCEEDSPELPDYIREFIDSLSLKLDIKFVLLFGSQARGEPRKYSDYDLFLVASELPYDYWERLALINKDKPVWVDIVAFTQGEVDSLLYRGLILDALLDGILLWGDRELFTQFRKKAQRYIEEKNLLKTSWGYFRKSEDKVDSKGG